jgi:PAS domain S-box-containing protein
MTSPELPLLALDSLRVSLDGRPALGGVTLELARGEIHAVVGSQGSGKSTLVKVIAGLVPRSSGRIIFDGRPLERHSPGNAQRLGILTLHQEPGLLPGLSAVENVFMNREIRKLLFFNDRRRMRAQLEEAFRALHLEVDPETPIRFLEGPVQQLIEIAKLACFPARLVVVDDPASRIRPQDVETLQYLLSVLRQNGATVLYATTSMEEVFNFASRVTVLDRGEIVETSEISNIDKRQLVQLTYASLFSRKKLEKSNLELFYLNNLNRNIINNIPVPILVADSRGTIILVNRSLENLTRLSPSALVGADVTAFLRLDDQQAERLRADIAARRRHEIREWQLATAAGEVSMDLSVHPILDEDQSFTGSLYLLDARESGGLFAAQRELFDRDQQNRRAIWETVHEANNPLGIMLNYLTLIRSSSSLDEIHANAEIMDRELKRVRRIFARLAGAGQSARGETRASLRDTVEEVLSLLKMNLTGAIRVAITLEKDYRVPLEPDLLKQVVLNIVLNAIEAMPGGGSLTLAGGCLTRAGVGYATLTVCDTGIGIPPELHERIFEPFYTTKSDSEARGLGLSLSRDIVSQVGGSITVESGEGGTAFTVAIPSPDVHCTTG